MDRAEEIWNSQPKVMVMSETFIQFLEVLEEQWAKKCGGSLTALFLSGMGQMAASLEFFNIFFGMHSPPARISCLSKR